MRVCVGGVAIVDERLGEEIYSDELRVSDYVESKTLLTVQCDIVAVAVWLRTSLQFAEADATGSPLGSSYLAIPFALSRELQRVS